MQIAFLRSRSGQLLRNEVQDGSSGQSNHWSGLATNSLIMDPDWLALV
jgi:hypothetical protein